jgi:hypothetical protein
VEAGPVQAGIRQERIEQKVAWFHGESDEVSGSPKILADLRDDGEIISRKTVAKAMRRLGLRGICPKRRRTTTIIDHEDAYPVDAVKREWDTGELNQVWVGDITYLRTWEGWLYLATVIDACSRRVIGWAIDEHMRADLVEDALGMAITLRGELLEQVIFHSDRGATVRPVIAVMGEPGQIPRGGERGHVQCLQRQNVRFQGGGDVEADDLASEHIGHERDIGEALPGSNISDVNNPEPTGSGRGEPVLHQILRLHAGGVGLGGEHPFAAFDTLQTQ